MSISTRLAAFAAATALAFAGGLAVGHAIGPVDDSSPPPHAPGRPHP